MYLITVVPLVRGSVKVGQLTYFSRSKLSPGMLVPISIRKQRARGLIVSVNDVQDARSHIRASRFALKKIEATELPAALTPEFMRMLERMSEYSMIGHGQLLVSLTFAQTLTDGRMMHERPKNSVAPDTTVLQAEESERLTVYKGIVRESFARDESTLIIAPTLADVERMHAALTHGIEHRVFTLSSDIGTAKLKNNWSRIQSSSRAVVVIGTPPALSVPHFFSTIIVEREAAPAWRSRDLPHIDYRRAAEFLAHETHAACVLADFPVRVESRARIEFGELDEHYRPQARPLSRARLEVVDARATDIQKKGRRTFMPLSQASRAAITSALEAKQKIAILTSRRGVAPLTICNTCGSPVADQGGVPMTLTHGPHGNVFISRRTGEIRDATISCALCGGWDLVTLGIGAERVADFVSKHYPHSPVYSITADTAPTHRGAKKIVERMQRTSSAIVIGTERMLPYLTPCHTSIALVDPLLAGSSWRSDERALQLLVTLQCKTTDHLIIETRRPENAIIETVRDGALLSFYRTERELRETYQYPPFCTFIGLTWSGSRSLCDEISLTVRTAVQAYDLVGPLPPEQFKKNEWRARAVLRMPRARWPDQTIVAQLRTLPPQVSIVIDPDDIV